MSQIQAPRGTNDIFDESMRTWQIIEDNIRQFMHVYHITKMQTPVFEHTEVFLRNNESSDVVNKEMYTFLDKGNRSLTLRPEGTAGLVRAVAQHKLYNTPEGLLKYYYLGPNFRYERPQKGRMRIHHQCGVEYIGVKSPIIDAEVIQLGVSLLQSFGIDDVKVLINTLGDDASREDYRYKLLEHFKPVVEELCVDCQRRYTQNPLRILDCKVDQEHPSFLSLPKLSDSLSDASKLYFKQVIDQLEALGIQVEVSEKLVRGLDYYTDTVFEIVSNAKEMGAQATILAGGRYDGLLEAFGGPAQSGIGFGMGIERLIVAAEAMGIEFENQDKVDVYVLPMDNQQALAHQLTTLMRQNGYVVEMDYAGRSLKSQFKSADRLNAQVLVFVGTEEANNNLVNVKDIANNTQQQVAFDQLIETLDRIFEQKEPHHD